MTHGLASKRILIVEDEHLVALDIAHEVAARGAHVIGLVGTLTAALDAIATTDLDGAILDINLMGEMAFPAADALSDRHIPFVFATGYSITEIPARHVNVSRVGKPAAPGVICRALEAAMSTVTREE